MSWPAPFVAFVFDMLHESISPLSGGSWGLDAIPLQDMSLNASDIKIARENFDDTERQVEAWVAVYAKESTMMRFFVTNVLGSQLVATSIVAAIVL